MRIEDRWEGREDMILFLTISVEWVLECQNKLVEEIGNRITLYCKFRIGHLISSMDNSDLSKCQFLIVLFSN